MTDYDESGLGPPDATELRLRREIAAKIQRVAQALLASPEAVTILKRVGLTLDFTESEEAFLIRVSGANEQFPNWRSYLTPENKFSADIDRWAVVQALARRVVAGLFGSAADEDAYAYVFERTYAVGKPEGWNSDPELTVFSNHNINYADRQRDFKISFDEFYAVLREYAAWDQIPIVIAAAKEKSKEEPDDYASQRLEESLIQRPLSAHEKKIFRKHGLINDRISVRLVASVFRRDGLLLDDSEAVLSSARNINLRFIKDLHS